MFSSPCGEHSVLRHDNVACTETRIYQLAQSLARPVARGWLTSQEAEASIWSTTLRAARLGELQHHADDVGRIAEHVLDLHLNHEAFRRQTAAGAISRAIVPIVHMGAARHRVLAAAYHANALQGGSLTQQEVAETAWTIAWGIRHQQQEHAEVQIPGGRYGR